MKVNYSDEKVIKGKKSLFLAGPTVRAEQEDSWTGGKWRVQAVQILKELGFDGVVYVPEYHTMKQFSDEQAQFDWEWEALHQCDIVVFWVDRRFPELPALCTNVEFGFYLAQKRIVYGRPDSANKNEYLDKLYTKVTSGQPFNDLRQTLKFCVEQLNK